MSALAFVDRMLAPDADPSRPADCSAAHDWQAYRITHDRNGIETDEACSRCGAERTIRERFSVLNWGRKP